MAMTTTNLAAGPARLYIGNFGAVEPVAAAINSAPAASAWTEVGLTQGGVTLTVNRQYLKLTADQLADALGSQLTGREISVGTQLAELTLANYKIALGSGTVTTTGGSNDDYKPSTGDLTPDGDDNVQTYIALLLDSVGPNGKRRRAIVRKCLAGASVAQAFARDGQQVYPVTWDAFYVSSTVLPFEVWQAL